MFKGQGVSGIGYSFQCSSCLGYRGFRVSGIVFSVVPVLVTCYIVFVYQIPTTELVSKMTKATALETMGRVSVSRVGYE